MKTIRIGGAAVEPVAAADAVEVEPGVFSIIDDAGRAFEIRVSATEAFVAGHRYRYELEDPRQWKRGAGAAGASGPAAIVAPMPGKVVRILVSEGDLVTAGQGIVVVEAMKMQNELKSPRDGKVSAIKATPNQSVSAGAILALIEATANAETGK